MVRRGRLDAELVRRGLARSRGQAAELVAAGQVLVGGLVATKPATGVDETTSLAVRPEESNDYASRGGRKLAAALDDLPDLRVADRRCLDAGASTGGFTDVLLRRGAQHVVAVDVGYGQLVYRLQTDARVTVLDRTNVRTLDVGTVGAPVDLVVADLSFISLRLVLPSLVVVTHPDGDLLLMVKPQFEVGRDAVGAGGVVREPRLRAAAVRSVAAAAADLGLGVRGVTPSRVPGPAGNVEFFLWLAAGAPALEPAAVEEAVRGGPP